MVYYKVKSGSMYYWPCYKRGEAGEWRALLYKGEPIASTGWHVAYEQIRKRVNYDDAKLTDKFLWEE